jgi:hypothetical protein
MGSIVYVCPFVCLLEAVRNISRETGTQWGSLSSEVHGSSTGQKIPCLLRKLEVH